MADDTMAPSAGADTEVRLLDGRTVHAALAAPFQPEQALQLRLADGQPLAVPPAAWRAVLHFVESHAAPDAQPAPPFLLTLTDGSNIGGQLRGMRARRDGLQLRGIVADRSAQIYVPYLAMSGLAVEPAAGQVASTGRSSGRAVVLRSLGDVQRFLAVQGGRSAVAELPVIDVADATASAGSEEAMAPYRLAARLGLPVLELAALPLPLPASDAFPPALARRLGVVPVAGDEHVLLVATSEPANQEVLRALEFVVPQRIVPVLASHEAIHRVLSEAYDRTEDEALVRQLGLDRATGSNGTELAQREAERLSAERPVVKLVTEMIVDALHRRASDIHIRPGTSDVELLFRIDGELLRVRRFLRPLLPAIVSRIKVIGSMNLAEHRVPQDGRATLSEGGHAVDLRISVLPTVDGESVVIRLLNTRDGLRRLGEVGFSAHDEQVLRDILGRDHGMLLVTGPTGCGKSTTLYAALLEVRKENLNIITVEDPVEYHIPEIEQIQVNRAAGTTFARTLRNILRHDPDVIMIGEIRDEETAQIAVDSALTGHLVLSTLHTNNAASAVTRLLDLHIEPFLLRSTLLGVLAQRLARRLCTHCRVPEHVDPHVRELLGVGADEVFYTGAGCALCEGTGSKGRVAVYELLPVSAAVRRLIDTNADAEAIHRAAVEEGMRSITEYAVALARAGTISLREASRVRVE